MICEQCHKEKRSIAKFCRWCGHPLVSKNVLDRMVGLDDVKQQLKTVVDTYTYLNSRKDVVKVRLSVNTIIIGETGTGKTALAEIIRDYFFQHRIIDKPQLTMVDAVDYQRFVEKWDDNVAKAKGGILFFDNVQKLLPDRYSNPENAEELDRLNKKLQDIDQSGDYQLKRIALTGYASPDGLYDKNYKLAQQRSELAKSLISRNFKREIFIYSNKPVVVGWNVVVDSLKAKGLTEEAETVDAIIKANKIIDRQTAQIQKLKFYATAIAPILPKLRIFKCESAYQTTRALEPEQILDNYLHNPDFQEGGKKMLSHYDYWHLFNMITDPVESEKLYKRAFYESKKNEARPWVYAANKLVVSYLKRDTMDLEVLRPFVDINVPHVNVERRTFAGHKYYVNIDRVVANQITEYYKAEHNDTAYYLAKMLPDVEEFREIRSFSIVKGTMFKKNKTPEQKEELAKAIEVVQNSSPINKAVIQIAQNRNKEAAETVASLNDEDPRKWYMKAVLDSRDMDFVAGATDLDHCFQLDKKYIVIMENDGDISDDVKEMWQDMYGSAMSE